MFKTFTRIGLALVGIALAVLGTTGYYSQTIECLEQLKGLAEGVIPTILAVAAVYQVASSLISKK